MARMSQTSDHDHPPAPGDVPNEEQAEEEFGVTDDGRPLAEQGLLDEDGIDRRLYSGEPVPTEHGFVIPEQEVVGTERTVGGGEWPEEPDRGVDDQGDDDEDRG